MNNIDTISDLLSFSGSQYRIYDIGRRIAKLSKEVFNKVEHNQLPYPYPNQGHAHLAITFWQNKSAEPYLWFIKLPLDERGLLNQGARNHFIAIIIDALGNDLTVNPTERQAELLKANPYNFTPAQYKLAALNSKISYELKQTPSSFYRGAHEYLSGKQGWQAWHNIGVQGLTDIACRVDQAEIQALLIPAIAEIPKQVLEPLCTGLENEPLPAELLLALIGRHQQSLANSNAEHFILRALASSGNHPFVRDYLLTLIEQQLQYDEIAILIAARCWEVLSEQAILMRYFEQLNQHQNQQLFLAMFKDLVSIPLLRPHVFACLRDPKRSNALAQTLGELFNQPTSLSTPQAANGLVH